MKDHAKDLTSSYFLWLWLHDLGLNCAIAFKLWTRRLAWIYLHVTRHPISRWSSQLTILVCIGTGGLLTLVHGQLANEITYTCVSVCYWLIDWLVFNGTSTQRSMRANCGEGKLAAEDWLIDWLIYVGVSMITAIWTVGHILRSTPTNGHRSTALSLPWRSPIQVLTGFDVTYVVRSE